jgi:hypothetical protein
MEQAAVASAQNKVSARSRATQTLRSRKEKLCVSLASAQGETSTVLEVKLAEIEMN